MGERKHLAYGFAVSAALISPTVSAQATTFRILLNMRLPSTSRNTAINPKPFFKSELA